MSKTVLITGATNGIGRAAAHALAEAGWRVLVAARNRQRAQTTIEQIRQRTGTEQIEAVDLDLTSFASVRRAAADALERAPQLDVLINNAGLNLSERRLTADGLETMMQTNHFGHVLLTSLLLPRLLESEDARVVNVTSVIHQQAGAMPLDDLNLERRWGTFYPYGVSKLANILFSNELHRRYRAEGIASFAVHPGAVRTNFGQNGMMSGPMSWLLKVLRPVILSPERGAAPLVELAVHPDRRADSGAYFSRHRRRDPSSHAQNADAAAKLWDASNEISAAQWPEV